MPTLKEEAKAILSWLVAGAKRWAEAVGYAELPPEISIEADPDCCGKD